MAINERSGSINYTQDSGSYYVGSYGSQFDIDQLQTKGFRVFKNFEKPPTTIPGQLTVKYFQRVYDDGTAGYCYYTKTTIDPTPSSGETTPNYTGAISDHSVVRILEIY